MTKALDYHLKADGNGLVSLAPDGSGVRQISDGGYLDATLDKGGQSRRVRYVGAQGGIQRQFWVNGQIKAWGVDADRFVAELMPILFRETGLNANERVDWLLKERGADALLAEIALIDSDSIQGRYIGRYAETASIPPQTLERLLAMAGKDIDSDSQLGATLEKIFDTQKTTGRQLVQLLKAALSIDSDSQAQALAQKVGPAAFASDEITAAYFDLARTIDSDSQMQAALSSLVANPSVADARIGQTLELAGTDIDSDSQLSALLIQAAPRVGASEALAQSYLKAAASVDSDSQSTAALMALAENARLSPASWRGLLDAAGRIGSDSQKSSLLVSVAERLPRQADVEGAYRSAVKTIGSDSNRRRAEQALN